MGPDNTVAEVLGIPEGVGGVEALAKRRKEHLNVGWMNNRYFVSQLHVLPAKIQVIYDEKFKVTANEKMGSGGLKFSAILLEKIAKRR